VKHAARQFVLCGPSAHLTLITKCGPRHSALTFTCEFIAVKNKYFGVGFFKPVEGVARGCLPTARTLCMFRVKHYKNDFFVIKEEANM
jgi:hypothetical protein